MAGALWQTLLAVDPVELDFTVEGALHLVLHGLAQSQNALGREDLAQNQVTLVVIRLQLHALGSLFLELTLQDAAIHVDRRTCDVGGHGRSEEQGGVSNLFGFAEAAEGDQSHHVIALLIGEQLGVGVDLTG